MKSCFNIFYIFEVNLLDTCTRMEKYPSKLGISRSFIRIFVRYLGLLKAVSLWPE